ncbi:gluconokinase [Tomitella gaofuii]|uniref:gluconokinase n=1 Tax=Tomitella gaofuii TaxID=2760083 RepID=UPI0015FB39F8|nr:gluconokinase [Tomitella gaofuii]
MTHGSRSGWSAPSSRGLGTLIVMGVSGSGKTTVAALLAEHLGRPMLEGDDLHSDDAVTKMGSGHALTDADRWPWLRRVRAWILASAADGAPGVVACSALRRTYRDLLRGADGGREPGPAPVLFVHLHVGRAELHRRLEAREGHYMKAPMLDSQLATLEPPTADEPAITVDAAGTPGRIVDEILRRLDAR